MAFFDIASETLKRYFNAKISKSAAALSYYLIMCVFPVVIIVNGFVGLLDINETDILDLLYGILPANAIQYIYNYVLSIRQSSTVLNLTAIYVIMTSLSAVVRVYRHTSDQILGVKSKHGITAWILSFALALGMVFALFLSCILIMCGKWFISLFSFGTNAEMLYRMWSIMRFFVMLLVLYFMIFGVYTMANTDKTLNDVRLGAVFSALILVISSAVFSNIVSVSMKYEMIYGSIASLIALMLWFNIFGNIIFVGNILNVVVSEKSHKGIK